MIGPPPAGSNPKRYGAYSSPWRGPSRPSHFVGRAAELGRLHAAFDAAQAGDAIALCIAGEAGVGKTRLVTRFAEQVSHAGGQVLLGGCIDLAEGSFAVRARDSSAARPRAPYQGPRAHPRDYR